MTPEAFESIGLSLPVIIGISVAVVALLIGGTLIALDWYFDWDALGCFLGAIIGGIGVIAALVVVVPLIWQSPYHYQVYRVQGTITNVSNVLAEASGDLTRQPVIELDTVDRPLITDDARFVNYEGHDVTLTCGITWRFQSADRYICELYELHSQETP